MKKRSMKKAILIPVGVILLLAAAGTGYWYYKSLPQPSPGAIEIPVVEEPAPNLDEPAVATPEVPPLVEATPETPVLVEDLIQKVAVSYDSQGNKISEAVLTLEKEAAVNYDLITISEYVADAHESYFATIAGRPYEVRLRGETPLSTAILSITYTEDILKNLDLIPADLRIGYLSFDKLQGDFYREDGKLIYVPSIENIAPESTVNEVFPATAEENLVLDDLLALATPESTEVLPVTVPETEVTPEVIAGQPVEIWEILKAKDLDDKVANSITSVLETGVREGIFAVVPINVNDLIELSAPPVIEPPDIPEVKEVIPAVDSDQDLLTDSEELLYGTNPLLPDSDGDGYSDGSEVLNLYSPGRGKDVSLEADHQFARWNNLDYNYSILIPAINTPQTLDSTRDVIFKANDQESILLSVQENDNYLNLKDWLLLISPEMDVEKLKEITTRKMGFQALATPDGTTYYLAMPGNPFVYVFAYTSKSEYTYLTTIRMMVESFEYLKDKSDLRYCDASADCVMEYNVRYRNNCEPGCYNKSAIADASCAYQGKPFDSTLSCSCDSRSCVLR